VERILVWGPTNGDAIDGLTFPRDGTTYGDRPSQANRRACIGLKIPPHLSVFKATDVVLTWSVPTFQVTWTVEIHGVWS
jgi:hypothetical protein